MNERINKLKEQAKEKVISHGAYGETEIYWEINVDKFAELIVRECVEVLRMVPYDCDGPEFGDEVVYQEAVKKHFGVEK